MPKAVLALWAPMPLNLDCNIMLTCEAFSVTVYMYVDRSSISSCHCFIRTVKRNLISVCSTMHTIIIIASMMIEFV